MVKAVDSRAWYALAVARMLLGLIFLWAFFDKLFGLGYATPTASSWVNGGSPTKGFLLGVQGPFTDIFQSLIGHGWVDWLFMLGLLGVGVGLLFGIAMRLSVVFGALLLLLMWMASLPIKTNPLIDDHVVYIAVLVTLYFGSNNQKLSLVKWWEKIPLIKRNAWLK